MQRGLVLSRRCLAILKFHPKWDAPEQVDLTGDVPGATQEDLFSHDARLHPAGKPRPAKKTKSDTTTSTGGSSASTQFGELIEQELRLKRKAAERAFKAQAKKDGTLMRLEELRFLATSTKDFDDDAYWIKKQKRLIKNKIRNDLGDEDDEDDTGDLYLVTAPSRIPHAFLVSQHTWHQRLGHPGGEVLHPLVSSNFISYNKENPPVLCHACQLGKHVRLPFVSSSTVINSCFDTIHSEWVKYSDFTHSESFSPVVKPGAIRTVLSLAASRHWPIHQLDVNNAFLHGDLYETIYMHQPPRNLDSVHPNYGTDTAYLLLYVNDIVLASFSESLLQQIIGSLHKELAMTDLGSLNYFLGCNSSGLFLSQKKYASEILDRARMVNCNPSRTPVDTESKLGADGDPISDPTLYRSLAEPHFSALKRILRYVQGTLDYGLQLFSSYTTKLVAYSDANWACCPTTRRSTSGYCVFLGNNLLSWSSKRHPTLSRSNAEAEYHGVDNAVVETCWLCNLLRQVRVLHVPSRYQFLDIFTKGLSSALFEEFRSSLSVRCPPA
nr:hypothetical protein [Tanacetum cinerariifolium]